MRRTICVGCVLALCACERAGNGEKTVELPVPKVTVHVIDPGAEPRAVLRQHAKAGATATFVATATGEFDQPRRGAMPTQTFTYEASIADVAADGVIHVRQRILAGKSAGRAYDAWQDARGAHVRPPLATLPSGDEIHDDGAEPETMLIAPEEAVGVGARWHDDVTYAASTASVDVELLSRDGDRVRERLTYHVDGPIRGSPAHRDGTIMEEFALGDPDGSIHQVETFAIEFPQGHAHGTRTIDIVRKP